MRTRNATAYPLLGMIPMGLMSALLIGFLAASGCAQEATPHTEKTAEVNPAMNAPDPKPTSPTGSDRDDNSAADSALDAGLGEGDTVTLSDEQWRAVLSRDEFAVLRNSGTERPFTGRYHDHPLDKKGAFHCVGCGNYLYDAEHKFHSGCGWPSFYKAVAPGAITEHRDTSYFMVRTEMRCARCDGHLGHIFDDGFGTPTGMRHCVNGTALIFVPQGESAKDVIKAHRAKYAGR